MSNDPRNEPIIITLDEAKSSHVDDLLKRQAAMRGDTGVTRDRKRAWFFQSWFVFMMVGGLAALAVWGVTEPFYNDREYVEGTISQLSLKEESRGKSRRSDGEEGPTASFFIGKQKLLAGPWTRLLRDGKAEPLKLDSLEQLRNVGVYGEYFGKDEDGQEFAVATFIVRDPPAVKAGEASMSMEQQASRSHIVGMLLFPLMAGLIGLSIGAVDGLICRLMARALISGGIGLAVGFVGGFITSLLAEVVYHVMTSFVHGDSPMAFVMQMTSRGLAWALAGLTMGLGQGISLRSKRLLIYGLLGGVVGGLLGGLVFDPIGALFSKDNPSGALSRCIGFTIIGLSVGAMIGIVELLARDAWLRMTKGPLAGKEFLIFKDVLQVGSSPRSDIYLFNDPEVLDHHAMLRSVGDECEIESLQRDRQVLLNGRPVQSTRLRHGDEITIGRTVFVFQKKTG